MAQFLVRFTPLEPYFFGGDKTFSFEESEKQTYFIFSETLPQQTTFLGALRYFFLPEKDPLKVGQYAHLVGAESFDVRQEMPQDFGVIRCISPFFLLRGEEILVRTPMDHRMGYESYTPFGNFRTMQTIEGMKEYTEDFDAKNGVADGFISLDSGRVYPIGDLITKQEKVRATTDEEGSSKVYHREYCRLKEGFSFAIFAELDVDPDTLSETKVIYLGQRKSAFSLQFCEAEGEFRRVQNKISLMLDRKTVYFFGDALVFHSIYEKSSFSVTQLVNYRSFMTKEGSIEKGKRLYHLIRGGSILRCDDEAYHELCRRISIENYQNIGWNHIIRGTK
ncbi:MAG: hypothetical protein IJB48_01760 [Clostridia bacterium]|nr:hypothetical protein [Clostridia bacterium]